MNLNSHSAGTLNMHKEEENESTNSTASVHGSEPTNEMLDSNRFKRDDITEEMMHGIREEEPLER